MKWEIRTEPDVGTAFSLTTGQLLASSASNGHRVRFRKAGTRGRFQSFVLVDAASCIGNEARMQEVVSRWVELNRPGRGGR